MQQGPTTAYSLAMLRTPLFDPEREPTRAEVSAYRRAVKREPCAYCSEAGGSTDHIEPTFHGGGNGWDNLTGSCKRCNETKRTLSVLHALLWVPLSRDYHDMRRILFGHRGEARNTVAA